MDGNAVFRGGLVESLVGGDPTAERQLVRDEKV